MKEIERIELFGLPILNITLNEAAKYIVDSVAEKRRLSVCFLNAHCVNVAESDADYRGALNAASLIFADGIGVRIAASLSGADLKDNVNGTDLFPLICNECAEKSLKIALLGAKPGIADLCGKRMEDATPGLSVVWTHDGYFNREDSGKIIAAINESEADVLFVAMGVPGQDVWIKDNFSKLKPSVSLGVGALFDFYSGTISRAPYLIRIIHLEWLYRLAIEPRRMFSRYVIGNPVFLSRVLASRIHGRSYLRSNPLGK